MRRAKTKDVIFYTDDLFQFNTIKEALEHAKASDECTKITKKELYNFMGEDLNESVVWEKGKKSPLTESKQLNEGTSNFGWLKHLPLLAFFSYDEVLDSMHYRDDCPQPPKSPDYMAFEDDEEFLKASKQYKDEYSKYEQELADWEDSVFEEAGLAILDGFDLDLLQSRIDDFNKETRGIADAYYDDDDDFGVDDYNVLKDIKVSIEPGYYQGAYIGCNDDDLDELSPKVKEEQLKRFEAFFKELKDEFGLTQLGVSARFSSGETMYSKVNESVNLIERRWRYTLQSGKQLRQAINSGDYEDIRQALIDCYDELLDKGFIDEYDHDDWTEEVRDYDFESDDDVDFELDQLYDLCDNIDVFIALDESLKESIHEEGFDKIVLSMPQKEFLVNDLYVDEYSHDMIDTDKEWVLTNDKSYDDIRSESDDEAFPYCLLIDGKLFDAFTKEFVDEIRSMDEALAKGDNKKAMELQSQQDAIYDEAEYCDDHNNTSKAIELRMEADKLDKKITENKDEDDVRFVGDMDKEIAFFNSAMGNASMGAETGSVGESLEDMDIDEWVLTKIREANAPQMTVASYFDSSSWKDDIETRLTGGDKQPLKLVVAKWDKDNSNKMNKLKEYDITDDMTLGELENTLTKLMK